MWPRAADLDSVPVGVSQMAGAPESLYVWLENREMIAMGNIYCGGRVCKRKNVPETAIKAYWGSSLMID